MSQLPQPFDRMTEVAREVANRPFRQRTIEVLDYKPSSVMPDRQLALSGTITVFIARAGSELIKHVRHTVTAKEKDGGDRRLAAQVRRIFIDRKPKPIDDIVDCIRGERVISQLRHGNATLVENILLPDDLEAAVIPLPYNGGRLAANGLTFVEHYLQDDDQELDVVALRHAPPLTTAEKAALKQVPVEMVEVNVGRGPGDAACSVLLLTVAVAVEVAVVAATFTVVKALDDHSMDHINPAAIADLGPVGTARALVNLRRDILANRVAQAQQF